MAPREIDQSQLTKVTRLHDDAVNKATHQRVIQVVRQLVPMMKEESDMVYFFDKWDEQQRIKRTILNETFGSSELVLAITERFMGLARVKFK